MRNLLKVKGVTFGAGRPVVCVPIVENSADGIFEQTKKLVNEGVHVVEWRVDLFDEIEDVEAVKNVLMSLKDLLTETVFLFSIRTKQQGGNAVIVEDDIVRLNELAADSGVVDIVDLEFFEASKPIKEIQRLHKKGVKVIASHHDFEKTPCNEVLHMLMHQMYDGGADIAKISVFPQTPEDVIRILQHTIDTRKEYPNLPIVTIAMGPLGILSRVSGELTGSVMTFGSVDKCSAPGQLPIEELSEVLDILHKNVGRKRGCE